MFPPPHDAARCPHTHPRVGLPCSHSVHAAEVPCYATEHVDGVLCMYAWFPRMNLSSGEATPAEPAPARPPRDDDYTAEAVNRAQEEGEDAGT